MNEYPCFCGECNGLAHHRSLARYVAQHTYLRTYDKTNIYNAGYMNACPFCGHDWGNLQYTSLAEDSAIVARHLDECSRYHLAIVAGRFSGG